jgi:hypothetical protein
MKKNIMFMSALAAAFLVTGCATSNRQPVTGFLYSDVAATENVTDNAAAPKMGEACAQSILGWFATGDASMEAARKAGGITSVSYVDNYTSSILGVYAKYCLRVHGK